MKWVRIADLRTRCKVLTWQELAEVLPPEVRRFLDKKYGIVASRPHSKFVQSQPNPAEHVGTVV